MGNAVWSSLGKVVGTELGTLTNAATSELPTKLNGVSKDKNGCTFL